MDRPDWAPDGADLERPSPARVYDYFLGGSHNVAADRVLAEQLIAAVPATRWMAQQNRAFLRRAVRYLVGAGVRQFLDLGSGIPTVGNVHQIAQAAAPDARVLYVDIDPVAVTHTRQILADNPHATAIQADLRRADVILDHPDLRDLLDLHQPVAVLLVSVLHFVTNADDPAAAIARFRDALPTGSYLVISHLTSDSRPADIAQGLQVSRAASIARTTRTREQVEALFAGFTLVEPGLVWAPLWRPDSAEDVDERPERASFLVAVGRTL
jgi:SAM-dependent methyltransferase